MLLVTAVAIRRRVRTDHSTNENANGMLLRSPRRSPRFARAHRCR